MAAGLALPDAPRTRGTGRCAHAPGRCTPAGVHWVGVGRRSNNVGITNLAVRKSYAGSFEYQAFVSLVNYTPEAQTFDFSLEVDGRSLAEKSVTLEPSALPSRRFAGPRPCRNPRPPFSTRAGIWS